jgi:hypothetical protein
MAPAAVIEAQHLPQAAYPTKSVPEKLFDPSIHLAYQRPAKIYSLADLKLGESPISPVGSTDPFPFLSAEGVRAFRRELFSKEVLDNCMYSTRPGSAQLRGMAPRFAPFVHQFWTSPEVLKIVSDLAGVDLVPVMNHEICHTNVQLGPDGVEGVKDTPIDPPAPPNGYKVQQKEGDEAKGNVIVPWHRDSHPFVCVVMLSDTEYMTDGETEIQKGDGTTVKVRSPEIVRNPPKPIKATRMVAKSISANMT